MCKQYKSKMSFNWEWFVFGFTWTRNTPWQWRCRAHQHSSIGQDPWAKFKLRSFLNHHLRQLTKILLFELYERQAEFKLRSSQSKSDLLNWKPVRHINLDISSLKIQEAIICNKFPNKTWRVIALDKKKVFFFGSAILSVSASSEPTCCFGISSNILLPFFFN